MVSSTRSTWRVEVFPTSVTTGVAASSNARMLPSSSQRTPARRVLPKAAILARAGGGLPHPPEELGVLGVGAGPAALDVVHAEPVEGAGDLHLVLHREREPLALGAVAEGGVVEPDRGAGSGVGMRHPEKESGLSDGEAACRC